MASSRTTAWDKTKTTSKKGFDKVWGWADKLGAPINRFSNRIGSEAFWPTTLDKESDKAARILRSFCKDGFYTEEEGPTGPNRDGPKQKQRVLKKIPQRVIERAVGLAIFTTMRTGLWISGAGGSGVLVARKEDGTWSEPSGILLHTAGLGFLVGVDIYDCVLVINNRKALESFTKVRATLGGEISAVAGPVGAGGVLEHDGKWKQANRPVFTYLKSRGFYAGVQVDGTVVVERTDENKRFYHQDIRAIEILAGKVRHRPPEVKMLMETLKAAEGRSDVDAELMDELEGQPAPGDVSVEAPGAIFGVPDPEDPDPYGVLALEKEGFEIREAATQSRPSSQLFAFNPSPKSPVYNAFHGHRRTESNLSTRLAKPYVPMVDVATQTIPVLIEPHPDTEAIMAAMAAADAAALEKEEEERERNGNNSSTNSLGLVVPEAIVEDEERSSIYEDVPDAPMIDGTAPVARGASVDGNPWSAEAGNPYTNGGQRPTKPVVLPRGPPPPLPPRSAVAKPAVSADAAANVDKVDDFEEISLNGGERTATKTEENGRVEDEKGKDNGEEKVVDNAEEKVEASVEEQPAEKVPEETAAVSEEADRANGETAERRDDAEARTEDAAPSGETEHEAAKETEKVDEKTDKAEATETSETAETTETTGTAATADKTAA